MAEKSSLFVLPTGFSLYFLLELAIYHVYWHLKVLCPNHLDKWRIKKYFKNVKYYNSRWKPCGLVQNLKQTLIYKRILNYFPKRNYNFSDSSSGSIKKATTCKSMILVIVKKNCTRLTQKRDIRHKGESE